MTSKRVARILLATAAVGGMGCGLDIQPTPEQVCAHFSSCATSYGNPYDTAKCQEDVRNIDSQCPAAADVKRCLLAVPCSDDAAATIGHIFTCYGQCGQLSR